MRGDVVCRATRGAWYAVGQTDSVHTHACAALRTRAAHWRYCALSLYCAGSAPTRASPRRSPKRISSPVRIAPKGPTHTEDPVGQRTAARVVAQCYAKQSRRRCGGVRRSAHVPPGLYSRAPAVGCVANRRRRCSAGRTPAAAWAVRNHRLLRRRRRRRQVAPQLRCSPTHAVHAHTSRCASAACRCALQGLQRRFCAQLSAPISRGSMPFEYLSLFFSGDRFRS